MPRGQQDDDESAVPDAIAPSSRSGRKKRRPGSDTSGSSSSMKTLWSLSGIGLEILASILGMGLIGWWLDGKTGSSPWLMVTGLILGIVGGLYNAIKQVLNIDKGGWPSTKERKGRHGTAGYKNTGQAGTDRENGNDSVG